MRYMVELQVKPESINKILNQFELRGPNTVPGVRFRQAWISTKQDVIFALGDADSEAALLEACHHWDEFGTYRSTPVVDIEDY